MAAIEDMQRFNASSVELSGSNLIEASAGTGKTYSIAILALRLLIEKGISVKEILMVTFTKAAVAELEERIRLFIRLAYQSSLGEEIPDSTIARLVESEIDRNGEQEIRDRLKTAVLFLDETSVLTIHSFCQQTLSEFAFETNQLFGSELVADVTEVVEEEINKFWRGNVTVLPPGLLAPLISEGLSRKSLTCIVKDHLAGKRYLGYEDGKGYSLCEDNFPELIGKLKELKDEEEGILSDLEDRVRREAAVLKATTNKPAINNVVHLIDIPSEFLQYIRKGRKKDKWITTLYGDSFLPGLIRCDENREELKQLIAEVKATLNCMAISAVSRGFELYKRQNNRLFFEDLIADLHRAVQNNREVLAERLSNKYKAVFIDEFQDTDRQQYEIFDQAFGAETIIFYIGDPKQSIYAWRKADIFTYFKAREKVDKLFTMNTNYRSNAELLRAMNHFFLPEPDFDTFHFGDAEHAIRYQPVDAPEGSGKGRVLNAGAPLRIIEQPSGDSLNEQVVLQVLDLLTNKDIQVEVKGEKRPVRPSDIGILVRANRVGAALKKDLARKGIPAVTIGDDKILSSSESKYMLYLLQAMSEISRASINKALLSPFTGFSDVDILKMDEQLAIDRFRSYKDKWINEGVYPALKKFAADYRIRELLLSGNSDAGERIITNFHQLVELMHRIYTTRKLSQAELINWLQRGIDGMQVEGDEFNQRVESDEDSVKIVTIHKSKGLEYNIVLAPYLDMGSAPKDNTSFRDPESGDYVSGEKIRLDELQFAEIERQLEQENRRLIYVALTRAVYQCYVFRNKSSKPRYTSLSPFLEGLMQNPMSEIEYNDISLEDPGLKYIAAYTRKDIRLPQADFELAEKNWTRMSFTALTLEHQALPRLYTEDLSDPYEKFIFSTLQKGARTGNLLHFIFENMHFSEDAKWNRVIEKAIQRFAPQQSERYAEMLPRMLLHVMNARLGPPPAPSKRGIDGEGTAGAGIETAVDDGVGPPPAPSKRGIDAEENSGRGIGGEETSKRGIEGRSFSLAEVDMARCIHEFEFDFKVDPFNTASLAALNVDMLQLSVKDRGELEGVMNGKIDLFFEHQGKYYVLDWKSNFLGDSLNCYTAENLLLAMNENNYHLQHLIYTLAVQRYLSARLPDFDYDRDFGGVIYLFVRGVREDSDSGIFWHKTDAGTITRLEEILSREAAY